MPLLLEHALIADFAGEVEEADAGIKVNAQIVCIFNETDYTDIQWGKAGADYIAAESDLKSALASTTTC